jgi:DNA-binding CsgD family transcriptional regulator
VAGQSLSPRELQVARLKGEGLTNRQITEALFLSVKTVEGHQTTIRKKLGLSSAAEFRECLEDWNGSGFSAPEG